MKEYEDLDESLRREIQSVCESDPYGLHPETLYKNIYHSSGDANMLAKIFEVTPSLVKAIKDS